MKQLRVVWICHLSSEELRSHLHLYNNTTENWIRRFLKKKIKVYSDRAPWNILGIKEFEGKNAVELHIISPHRGMKQGVEEFQNNGIYYHFYQEALPFPLNELEKRFNPKQFLEFPRNRKRISCFLKKINPDIVNLIGAECPYFSISALDIEDVPLYVSCQTIYSNPERKLKEPYNTNPLNWDVEQKVFKRTCYYGCSGIIHYDLVKHYVPDAIVFPIRFLSMSIPEIGDVPKTEDFAFWGRVTKSKGIENAIEALAIVKEKFPDVSMLVAGGSDLSYQQILQNKTEELGLKRNVRFIGRVAQLENLLTTVKHAHYAILPIKLDVISSTIYEAMKMGMPVVTHRTTGTPLLNQKRECVLISEIDDVPALANNMIRLMESPEIAERLKQNSYQYLAEQPSNSDYAEKYIRQYRAIIAHYHEGTPIPEHLLFNPKDYTT